MASTAPAAEVITIVIVIVIATVNNTDIYTITNTLFHIHYKIPSLTYPVSSIDGGIAGYG